MVIYSVRSAVKQPVNDRLVFATNEHQDNEKLNKTKNTFGKTFRPIPKKEKTKK
jgi:hypothetical protein